MPIKRFAQQEFNREAGTNILRLQRRSTRIQQEAGNEVEGLWGTLATKADLAALAASEAAQHSALTTMMNAEVAARSYAVTQEGIARVAGDSAEVTARNAALASAIAALNLGTASTKATAYFEPAVAPGAAGQFYRGDKTWVSVSIGDVSGLSSALTGLSDAYKAADTVLDTKINGRLKRVSLGNVTVTWGAQLLTLGVRDPVDKAVTGLLTSDILTELRPAAAMPAGYAMTQAYIKANGTLTLIFYTPGLTLLSPAINITFEVIVLRSGA